MGSSRRDTFQQALRPLSERIVREHQILHFSGEVCTGEHESVASDARTEILKWTQKRRGGAFPSKAWIGESFEDIAAGRNSIAVRLRLPGIDAWAIRQEDPDKNVAGRVWTTEAVVWKADQQPVQITSRLIASSNEAELDIAAAVPGFVCQLANRFDMRCGGNSISSNAVEIDPAQNDDLIDQLTNPNRRLPMILISTLNADDLAPSINADDLARALCGLARVATITAVRSGT